MSAEGLEKLKQKIAAKRAQFPGTTTTEPVTPAEREANRIALLEAALPQIRAFDNNSTESGSDIHVIGESYHRKGDRHRYSNTPPPRH